MWSQDAASGDHLTGKPCPLSGPQFPQMYHEGPGGQLQGRPRLLTPILFSSCSFLWGLSLTARLFTANQRGEKLTRGFWKAVYKGWAQPAPPLAPGPSPSCCLALP